MTLKSRYFMNTLSSNTSRLLKEIRTKKGRSLDKLSKQLKVSQNFLSQVENNQVTITLDTLEQLLLALKIEQSDFFRQLIDMQQK